MSNTYSFRHLLLSQKGLGWLTFLVFGTIFGVIIYSAFKIIPFYYAYYEIKNQMNDVIKVASLENDEEIRKRLWYHIKKQGIPVEKDQLKIEREDHYMRIQLQYTEVFYITWDDKDYDIYTFPFNAYAEGPF